MKIFLELVILMPLVLAWIAILFMHPIPTLICSVVFVLWLCALIRYLKGGDK